MIGIKITVISTILNEADSIELFVESLFRQTLIPDEIVIVDGGSTDFTYEKLQMLSKKHSSLKIFQKKGFNISAGRNFAIKQATNSIVASVDGGATLQNDWLYNLTLPFFTDSTIDVVSGFFIPQVKNTFEKYLAAVTVPIEEELQDEKFLPSSRSIAFKKNCWSEVGGYPEWLPICEDVVFDIKMKNKGFKFVVAVNALSSWRPRTTLKKYWIQYFKYARGDGHAKLFFRRHFIRYITYLCALTFLWACSYNILWLVPLLLGGVVYTLKYYNRYFRHFPHEGILKNIGAYFYIPFLLLVGDSAKMVGFPYGIYQRLSGKIVFHK